MATAAWPGGLPTVPERAGYARRPKPAVIAFGTEVGPGKRRRRSTVRQILVECVLSLSLAQRATFETFFRDTVADGSLPFTMVDPVDGSSRTWLFDASEPYVLTPQGATHWRLTLKLEQLS